MQWDSSENAGFTTGEPWLPLMDDHKRINVEEEEKNENSNLNFYKRLIQLRNNEPALQTGKYIPVLAEGNMLSI
jgi:alpha-glucosidase